MLKLSSFKSKSFTYLRDSAKCESKTMSRASREQRKSCCISWTGGGICLISAAPNDPDSAVGYADYRRIPHRDARYTIRSRWQPKRSLVLLRRGEPLGSQSCPCTNIGNCDLRSPLFLVFFISCDSCTVPTLTLTGTDKSHMLAT